MRTAIALYFDLENVDEKLDLNKLLESISLNIEDSNSVFVLKLACGNTDSISKFREQMKDLNFEIRETPKVSEKNLKNRADLILSLEAFESLYQQKPEIDLYVFITADTDFTVVMDKLRKYGKQIWLVTRKSDKDIKLFISSADKILVIEDNLKSDDKNKKSHSELNTILSNLKFSETEIEKISEVIESFEKDKWFDARMFGIKIHNLIKDFSYKGKNTNSQTKLFEKLKEKKIMELDKEKSKFKIIK